ncbi:MAG TPA: hypothetical protein VE172_17530 [Stackebrandtia sp.]|jgi:hypothetical protein|uniref:hypothetical protein n=1 Tax=Stackebrandtia sp. TaxID=2023065 RepID=UPI002D658C8C|nr:hypothetical protein [Stackebrandtia sp.]HZE40607.1 hypothetical protein [Stackebrandtia sp.]
MFRTRSVAATVALIAVAAVVGAIGVNGLSMFAASATDLIAFPQPGQINPHAVAGLAVGLVMLAFAAVPLGWAAWRGAFNAGPPPSPDDAEAAKPDRQVLVAGLALLGLSIAEAARTGLGVLDGLAASAGGDPARWIVPDAVSQVAVIGVTVLTAVATMLGGEVGRAASIGLCGFFCLSALLRLGAPLSNVGLWTHDTVYVEVGLSLVQGIVAAGVIVALARRDVLASIEAGQAVESQQGL